MQGFYSNNFGARIPANDDSPSYVCKTKATNAQFCACQKGREWVYVRVLNKPTGGIKFRFLFVAYVALEAICTQASVEGGLL